jgi:hypothetical protein
LVYEVLLEDEQRKDVAASAFGNPYLTIGKYNPGEPSSYLIGTVDRRRDIRARFPRPKVHVGDATSIVGNCLPDDGYERHTVQPAIISAPVRPIAACDKTVHPIV